MARRQQLRAVTDTPLKALGMIRVSKERDGMISPEVQRAAIKDYAERRGYIVVDWVQGLDESGSRTQSAWWPRLDQSVARVESGEVDVIVVWKFSRTARNRLKWAVAVDRVEVAGGLLESATEQVDTSTSTGRFTRGMLAELNAFEAERIGEVWKDVHASRLARGRNPNGLPRFGYRYDREAKEYSPDPETGPVLVEMYRRFVAGESVYALARWLNAAGVATTAGNDWTDRSLRRVLDSGWPAGIIRWGGKEYAGEHDRLVDEDLWQAYLDARAARRSVPARVKRSPYLLSGMVRCGRCGGKMSGNAAAKGRYPKWRCRTAKEYSTCEGGYCSMMTVERVVLAWLQKAAQGVEDAAEKAALASAHRVDLEAEQTRLARRLVAIDDAVTSLTVRLGEGLVTAAAYNGAVEKLEVERTQLQERVEDIGRQVRSTRMDHRAEAAVLLDRWDELPVESRRELLGRLIEYVEITTNGTRHPEIVIVER